MKKPIALIGGLGSRSGFGAALIDVLSKKYSLIAIVRSEQNADVFKAKYKKEIRILVGDMSDPHFVKTTIEEIEKNNQIEVYIHNAARLSRSPFLETEPVDFLNLWTTSTMTAVLMSQAILPFMLEREKGTLLFSGATASLRGSPNFASFASSKFALRGLVQSLAREFGPKGIHVVSVIIDGVIAGVRAQEEFKMEKTECISPVELANTFLYLTQQSKWCWTHECDVRTFGERF